MFSKFHPNYIIGGTYSGQIVLWDTRAKSLPVLKTPLSAGGHTHPVYSIEMVGTQNAHNLISASTDGFVCSWQLDMLAQPQDYLELLHPAHNKTHEVSVTCMGFPDNETTAYWAGTEEGNVYQANRYDRAGSKAGINQYDTYRGHHGMVTGLNFHPLHGPVDFSDLYLTSSVDWTVKLWRAKVRVWHWGRGNQHRVLTMTTSLFLKPPHKHLLFRPCTRLNMRTTMSTTSNGRLHILLCLVQSMARVSLIYGIWMQIPRSLLSALKSVLARHWTNWLGTKRAKRRPSVPVMVMSMSMTLAR